MPSKVQQLERRALLREVLQDLPESVLKSLNLKRSDLEDEATKDMFEVEAGKTGLDRFTLKKGLKEVDTNEAWSQLLQGIKKGEFQVDGTLKTKIEKVQALFELLDQGPLDCDTLRPVINDLIQSGLIDGKTDQEYFLELLSAMLESDGKPVQIGVVNAGSPMFQKINITVDGVTQGDPLPPLVDLKLNVKEDEKLKIKSNNEFYKLIKEIKKDTDDGKIIPIKTAYLETQDTKPAGPDFSRPIDRLIEIGKEADVTSKLHTISPIYLAALYRELKDIWLKSDGARRSTAKDLIDNLIKFVMTHNSDPSGEFTKKLDSIKKDNPGKSDIEWVETLLKEISGQLTEPDKAVAAIKVYDYFKLKTEKWPEFSDLVQKGIGQFVADYSKSKSHGERVEAFRKNLEELKGIVEEVKKLEADKRPTKLTELGLKDVKFEDLEALKGKLDQILTDGGDNAHKSDRLETEIERTTDLSGEAEDSKKIRAAYKQFKEKSVSDKAVKDGQETLSKLKELLAFNNLSPEGKAAFQPIHDSLEKALNDKNQAEIKKILEDNKSKLAGLPMAIEQLRKSGGAAGGGPAGTGQPGASWGIPSEQGSMIHPDLVSTRGDRVRKQGDQVRTDEYLMFQGVFQADGKPATKREEVSVYCNLIFPEGSDQGLAIAMKYDFDPADNKKVRGAHFEIYTAKRSGNSFEVNFNDKRELHGNGAIQLQNAQGGSFGPNVWLQMIRSETGLPAAGMISVVTNDESIWRGQISPQSLQALEEHPKWGYHFEKNIMTTGIEGFFQLDKAGNLGQGKNLPGIRPPGTGFFDALSPDRLGGLKDSVKFMEWLIKNGGLSNEKNRKDPELLNSVRKLAGDIRNFNLTFDGQHPPGTTKASVDQACVDLDKIVEDYQKDPAKFDPKRWAQADQMLSMLQAMASVSMQELIKRAGKGKKERDLDALIQQWLSGNMDFDELLMMVMVVLLEGEDEEIARALKSLNRISSAQKGALSQDMTTGGFIQGLNTDSSVEQLRLQNLVSMRQRLIETIQNASKSHGDALHNAVRRLV